MRMIRIMRMKRMSMTNKDNDDSDEDGWACPGGLESRRSPQPRQLCRRARTAARCRPEVNEPTVVIGSDSFAGCVSDAGQRQQSGTREVGGEMAHLQHGDGAASRRIGSVAAEHSVGEWGRLHRQHLDLLSFEAAVEPELQITPAFRSVSLSE